MTNNDDELNNDSDELDIKATERIINYEPLL